MFGVFADAAKYRMAEELCKVRQLSPTPWQILKVEEVAAKMCRPTLTFHSKLFTAE